jgi:quinol monooxygenase YgiN
MPRDRRPGSPQAGAAACLRALCLPQRLVFRVLQTFSLLYATASGPRSVGSKSALPACGCHHDDVAFMNSKTLTVIAQIKAKPGQEGQVRQELLSLVAPSRQDAGCINYDLHQAADNPALFLFHENWASKAHLDAHLAKPDLQAALGRVGTMVAEAPQITLWEKIG